MTRFLRFVFLGAVFCAQASSLAASPVKPEEVPQPIQEVFQSDLLYPQEEREVQFTFLPTYKNQETENRYQMEMEFEYGLTDFWQLQIEWDGPIHRDPFRGGPEQTGAGDLAVGTQYSFMALMDGYTHAAVGLNVEIPVGDIDRNFTDGLIGVETYFTVARDFPQFNGAQIFSQTGVEWVSRAHSTTSVAARPPGAHSFFWNVGGFLPVGDLRGTLEINWENDEWNNSGTRNELFITPGVIWKISKEWELGVASPLGLTDDADDVRVVGMLVYEFEME